MERGRGGGDYAFLISILPSSIYASAAADTSIHPSTDPSSAHPSIHSCSATFQAIDEQFARHQAKKQRLAASRGLDSRPRYQSDRKSDHQEGYDREDGDSADQDDEGDWEKPSAYHQLVSSLQRDTKHAHLWKRKRMEEEGVEEESDEEDDDLEEDDSLEEEDDDDVDDLEEEEELLDNGRVDVESSADDTDNDTDDNEDESKEALEQQESASDVEEG